MPRTVGFLRLCWILFSLFSVLSQSLPFNVPLTSPEFSSERSSRALGGREAPPGGQISQMNNASSQPPMPEGDEAPMPGAPPAESSTEPSSLRAAIPSPETTHSSTTTDEVQQEPTLSSLRAAIPSPESSSGSLQSTTTSILTVIVTPSPIGIPASEAPVQAQETGSARPSSSSSSSPSTALSPSETLDLAPISTSTSTASTASGPAQAVIGASIGFGLISIVGITGLYLLRRRRNQRLERDRIARAQRSRQKGLAAFLLKGRSDEKAADESRRGKPSDPEFRIESASKVQIVRGASPMAVRAASRNGASGPLNSHPPIAEEDEGAVESESEGVLKVGMMVPDLSPTRPKTPSPIAFSARHSAFIRSQDLPRPPAPLRFKLRGQKRNSEARRERRETREAKANSWPLSD